LRWKGLRIAIYGESHVLGPASQKETDQGERNEEDEKREYKKCKWPASKVNQVLDERDEEKGAKSNANACQAIGHTSLFFEPVGENRCQRRDAEKGNTRSSDYAKIDIELEKGVNLCAKKKAQAHQKNSWKHHLSRTYTINEVTDYRGGDHIDEHSDGLSSSGFCATPMEMVDQSDEKNGKDGSEGIPKGHADRGQSHNDPAIKEAFLNFAD